VNSALKIAIHARIKPINAYLVGAILFIHFYIRINVFLNVLRALILAKMNRAVSR
jgi:hypothetical protein